MLDLFKVPECTNNVSRFAGKMIIGHRSSISEHSFEVSYYAALMVNELIRLELITYEQGLMAQQYAMVHDIPEIFTGDVPYTAKARFPELKSVLNSVEKEIEKEILPTFDRPVSDLSKFICKLADVIAVSREIATEIELRNPAFSDDELNNCKIIIENCFDAYSDKVPDLVEPLKCWVTNLVGGTSVETIFMKAIKGW